MPRGRVSLWGRGPGRYFWFAEVSDGIQGCQQQHNQPLLFHTGNKPCFYDNSFYDTVKYDHFTSKFQKLGFL